MKKSLLSELILYRYRYVLSYGLFAVLLLGVLLTDITRIPNGMSLSEMNSAVASNSLNVLHPSVGDIVNLPYHLLQKISISVFGLSIFSVRLPSILLAIGAGVTLAVMLGIWFRHNVAQLTALISVTSVPFISTGRLGVPTIMYTLLLFIILLGAIQLTSKKHHVFSWKMIVLVATLLLLYIPFGVYAFAVLAIAALIHPHIRYQISHTKPWQWGVFTLTSIAILLPIFLAGFYDDGAIRELLGISTISQSLNPEYLVNSFKALVKTLFFFTKPNVSETVTPFLNITFLFFISFGIVKIIIDRYAARSYLLLIWLAVSIPILMLDPAQVSLIFVPCVILLAIGIETVINEWYKLFPRNPYARMAALIPLSIMFVGLVSIAVTRYFYAYSYTDVRAVFHPELVSIRQVIDKKQPTTLVVPVSQVPFYDILRRNHPSLVVTPDPVAQPKRDQIVLASAEQGDYGIPSEILTTYLWDDGVLLRYYAKH